MGVFCVRSSTNEELGKVGLPVIGVLAYAKNDVSRVFLHFSAHFVSLNSLGTMHSVGESCVASAWNGFGVDTAPYRGRGFGY